MTLEGFFLSIAATQGDNAKTKWTSWLTNVGGKEK